MRPHILSPVLGACVLLAGIASAQNAGERNQPALPVGQTFLHFTFPVYDLDHPGQLKYTLFADAATGITINRAETTNLRIEIFDNGVKTTTITSPKADLIVADQIMRTKNTVLIERNDMEATSQDCNFEVKAKKFFLRKHVRVLLKHFDVGGGTPGTSTPAAGAAESATPAPVAPGSPDNATTPAPSAPMPTDESILPSPGNFSDTNAAPLPPPSSPTK